MAWLIIFPLHLITFKLRFTAYASHFFCFIDVMHACMCGLSRCVHAKVSMATCVCALVSVYALACAASNIDTRFPLLKTGADGTLFGLSVALHLDLKSRTHLWVTSDLAFVELDTHTHTHAQDTQEKHWLVCVPSFWVVKVYWSAHQGRGRSLVCRPIEQGACTSAQSLATNRIAGGCRSSSQVRLPYSLLLL